MKNQKEPEVAVGIVSGKQIRFTLNGPYAVQGTEFTGAQSVEISGKDIVEWQYVR